MPDTSGATPRQPIDRQTKQGPAYDVGHASSSPPTELARPVGKLQLRKHQLRRVEGTHPQPRCVGEHPHNSKPVEKLRFKKSRQGKSEKHSFPMPSRCEAPSKRAPSCPGAASTSPAPSQPTNDSPLQKNRPHNLQLAPASDNQTRLLVLSRSRATLGVQACRATQLTNAQSHHLGSTPSLYVHVKRFGCQHTTLRIYVRKLNRAMQNR